MQADNKIVTAGWIGTGTDLSLEWGIRRFYSSLPLAFQSIEKSYINIYPNPVEDYLYIDLQPANPFIYDIQLINNIMAG